MVFNQVILLVWIAVITGWIIYRELGFRRFLKSTQEVDIRRLLEDLLKQLSATKETVNRANAAISEIQKKDISHIQKIGLVRFNPFRDAGGNQSFTLAFLNEQNSGVVLTGLHARETTRIYIKDVVKGVSRSELSKEEKQALEVAVGKR